MSDVANEPPSPAYATRVIQGPRVGSISLAWRWLRSVGGWAHRNRQRQAATAAYCQAETGCFPLSPQATLIHRRLCLKWNSH